jgi:hypothetical protein
MKMHTMRKENDKGEFMVGFMEIDAVHGSAFVSMFHGMSIVAAIQLVSALNGGKFEASDMAARVLPHLWVK